MKEIKKYFLEAFGTMIIVVFGCGVSVLSNGNTLLTSISFGLAFICAYYMSDSIVKKYFNPSVALAMYIKKDIDTKEFTLLVFSEIIGGIIGACFLFLLFRSKDELGANFIRSTLMKKEGITFEKDIISYILSIVTEIFLTYVFVKVIIGVNNKNNSGIIIGLALILVHLLGVNLTGTSVNPARSIGVALLEGGTPLKELWIFIVGPLIGGFLASAETKCKIKM